MRPVARLPTSLRQRASRRSSAAQRIQASSRSTGSSRSTTPEPAPIFRYPTLREHKRTAGLCGSTTHSSPSGYTSTTARFSRAFSAKIEPRPGRSAPTNEAPLGYRAGRSTIPSPIAASKRCEARMLPGVRMSLLTVAMSRSSRRSHRGSCQARSAERPGGVARRDPHRLRGEVHIAPAQRQQLPHPQPIPGSVPLCAWSSTSRNHASAVRFVKWPSAGRPRCVHAGPSAFCTCRPSGSRYFAYQRGPRLPCTRKTCPLIGLTFVSIYLH
jgi:hypothetical protein